jgi:UDP-glucose 4-epimerase
LNTVLVTGASGFIGSRLCRRLINEGHRVHATSRNPHDSQGDAIRWSRIDLGNYDAVCALFNSIRPEIVFHLASRVTGSRELGEVIPIFRDNLASTVNILTSSIDAGCKRLVLAGSSEEPEVLDHANPCSPYAIAKWSSTAYAAMFRSLFHASVVVPRIFMTYGPGQTDVQKVVPYTIISMLRGESPKLGSGKRMVDWIFLDEVVEGLIKAALTPEVEHLTFDLGSGSLVSIRAVVEQIADLIGNGVKPHFGALPDRPFETERAADVRFMEMAFHWKPSKALRDGLRETIDWYRGELSQGLL